MTDGAGEERDLVHRGLVSLYCFTLKEDLVATRGVTSGQLRFLYERGSYVSLKLLTDFTGS